LPLLFLINMQKKRFYCTIFSYLLLFIGAATAQHNEKPPFSLNELQRRSFLFFWEQADATNYQVLDRYPTLQFSSIAATGFGLSSYLVGAERGWITRTQAAERVLNTLKILRNLPQGADARGVSGYRGFYYHFLDLLHAHRYEKVELSSIDTGLLMAGILSCMSYFDRADPMENAIRENADFLFRRVEFDWFLNENSRMSMGWFPERGFLPSDWHGYNEAMILVLMGMGSPTHPLPANAWEQWCKPYHRTTFKGQDMINFGPLFGHQYSHCWIDFKGIQDPYMKQMGIDYFENSRRATYSNRQYCVDNPGGFAGYGENIWGLTACDGPGDREIVYNGKKTTFHGYNARGVAADYLEDDGTIAPTAAITSLPFAPEICLPAAKAMWERWPIGQYGFYDGYNESFTWPDQWQRAQKDASFWVDLDYLGIDQGPMVMMIENYRSGLIWNLMKKNPYIISGLQRAGFTGGWLDTTAKAAKQPVTAAKFNAEASAQKKDPARKVADKIAPADLAADLEVLYDALKKSHPRYDQYVTRGYFDSVYQAKKAWILTRKDSITNGVAYLQLAPLAGIIRDGHTYFKESLKKTNFTRPRAGCSYLNGAYYLTELAPADSVFFLAKCLRINGISTDSLYSTFERIRTGDGWNETFPKRITGAYFYEYYQAQFGATDTWHIEAICADNITRTLTLKGRKLFMSKAASTLEQAEQKKKKREQAATKPVAAAGGAKDIVIIKQKAAAVLYRPKLDTSVVVMSINTFGFMRYRRFYRRSFRYLQKQNPRLFIVDVRENLGGSVSNVANLLGYLQKTPYNWNLARKKDIVHAANSQTFTGRMQLKKVLIFKKITRKGDMIAWSKKFKPHKAKKRYQPKQLVVLQNSFSFSGGSVTASALKNLCGATTIGNETGGAEVGFNALVSQKVKLPHSRMQLLIAGYSIDMDMGKPNVGRGVIPDQLVLPTLEDVKNKRDVMLEAAIGKVRRE